ncbi:hemerythrin domain-containing protein [Pelagicoccus sp. SDUM812003]|uniref:hemerythrin domain-containing protein n=1 Tax=Pelagicoccus sp. SDUM812003 TaxID=3041267 RepID=UPI00280D0A7C|nr:hemerythrin domain-containing protein [Pelagicoccus sp. SDUM812003]MDQ8204026.1 hemerythrin domain-containing protein [Pelagicoccus sp. SDUM812003]
MNTYHDRFREETPRLLAMAKRVATVHGEREPRLVEILDTFDDLSFELLKQLAKEELEIFPQIHRLADPLLTLEPAHADELLSAMRWNFDVAGEAMARIKTLSDDYQAPEHACNTYRALFSGLEEFEEDLRRHANLENAELFPAVLERLRR